MDSVFLFHYKKIQVSVILDLFKLQYNILFKEVPHTYQHMV